MPGLQAEASERVAVLPARRAPLEELLRVWPDRLDRCHGPLRAVFGRVLRDFLRSGLHSFEQEGHRHRRR